MVIREAKDNPKELGAFTRICHENYKLQGNHD